MNDLLRKETNKPFAERMYCDTCGAVYFAKSWHWNPAKRDNFEKTGIPSTTCSACYKTKNDVPGGILSFIGVKDKMKMVAILKDVEEIAKATMEREPLSRIIRVNEKSDETVIYTTEPSLAKKIGRHLSRSHRGSITTDDTSDSLTRVVWISKEI